MPIQIRSFPHCILLLVCVYKGSFSGTGAVDIYIYIWELYQSSRGRQPVIKVIFSPRLVITLLDPLDRSGEISHGVLQGHISGTKKVDAHGTTPPTQMKMNILLALRMAKIVKGAQAVMCTTKNEWKQNYTALTKKNHTQKNAWQTMPNSAQQNTATTERENSTELIPTKDNRKSQCIYIRITSRCLSTARSTFTTKEKQQHRLRPPGREGQNTPNSKPTAQHSCGACRHH